MALFYIGAATSKPVVDGVVKLLTDGRSRVKLCGIKAACTISGPDAMAVCESVFHALEPLLQDPDPFVRDSAVNAVGVLGKGAVIAEPVLSRLALLLEDPDKGIVFTTVTAIRRLETVVAAHEPIQNALRRLLKHPNQHIVNAAVAALETARSQAARQNP
jgi:HEAT repeat protein